MLTCCVGCRYTYIALGISIYFLYTILHHAALVGLAAMVACQLFSIPVSAAGLAAAKQLQEKRDARGRSISEVRPSPPILLLIIVRSLGLAGAGPDSALEVPGEGGGCLWRGGSMSGRGGHCPAGEPWRFHIRSTSCIHACMHACISCACTYMCIYIARAPSVRCPLESAIQQLTMASPPASDALSRCQLLCLHARGCGGASCRAGLLQSDIPGRGVGCGAHLQLNGMVRALYICI